jgi:anti-sigma regulatory factor (Ser/Thr protein kinase)
MSPTHRQYDDLHAVVDDVHALFDRLESDEGALPLDAFSLQVMKLAVHEWIANLVQHADFGHITPNIRLAIIPEGGRVRCLIEDNSRGFDFARQVVHQQHHLDVAPAPPDRGRGLLMLIACTENVSYQPILTGGFNGDGLPSARWHRLEFWVSPNTIDSETPDPAFDEAFPQTHSSSADLAPTLDLDTEDA